MLVDELKDLTRRVAIHDRELDLSNTLCCIVGETYCFDKRYECRFIDGIRTTGTCSQCYIFSIELYWYAMGWTKEQILEDFHSTYDKNNTIPSATFQSALNKFAKHFKEKHSGELTVK